MRVPIDPEEVIRFSTCETPGAAQAARSAGIHLRAPLQRVLNLQLDIRRRHARLDRDDVEQSRASQSETSESLQGSVVGGAGFEPATSAL